MHKNKDKFVTDWFYVPCASQKKLQRTGLVQQQLLFSESVLYRFFYSSLSDGYLKCLAYIKYKFLFIFFAERRVLKGHI
ncbi:hypothetical protein E3M52_21930 [Salmonella enterica]|nr:hypothetical protein [Salmonella enterica]